MDAAPLRRRDLTIGVRSGVSGDAATDVLSRIRSCRSIRPILIDVGGLLAARPRPDATMGGRCAISDSGMSFGRRRTNRRKPADACENAHPPLPDTT